MITRYISALFLFAAFMVVPLCSEAAKGTPNETEMCLACHSDKTMSKKLMNKEVLSLYINPGDFRKSVHAQTGCRGCHPNITLDNHPVVKKIKSRKDYAASVSRQCSVCHTAEQLRRRLPVHSTLSAKGICLDCHGSHYIMETAVKKTGVKENQYCMTCHSRSLTMSMKNGETISVRVDESALSSSVHMGLQCTECHTGFSMTQHPMRSYPGKRVYSITLSESCGKCHNKASSDYAESIHADVIKGGNLKAPACTDCHGFHTVKMTSQDANIGITSCNKCHGDMNASYEASMHGKARLKGDVKAPSCASCHDAHDVASTAATAKIKDGCLECHKDAGKLHAKWLSNPPFALASFAKAHFDAVSCAACHSPGAGRAVYLSLYAQKTGKPMSEEEVMKVLGAQSDDLLKQVDLNADGILEARELWDLSTKLWGNGVCTLFMGEIDVRTATEAHMIGPKMEGTKKCEACHHPEAEYFKDVFLVVKKADGKPSLFPVKNDVFNSIYSIIPVRKFYALGSTSIELFDILFVVALIGGIAVPIGHISLRIITSPLRSLRRMGKGGRK